MPEIWIGRTLSKVKVEQLIGRGGMADVYLGSHTTLNVPRAVKILHGHLTDDPELRRRFDEEAKAVASLRHPNIVQVYDLDLYEGQPYIVMELLQGMTLAAYLRGLHQLGHVLSYADVARLLDGLAAALDYAHARNIIHRDIKPANVLLRQGSAPIRPSLPLPGDAQPVLTDFGIARISTSTSQTLTGTILGTPAYMSPEQVRGEAVDARSDTYSLGILLYEMLSGGLPFDPDVDTAASVLYKQAHVTPPPLPNVPPAVRTVVDRALQKNPQARFQKAGELAASFHSAVGRGATTIVAPAVSSSASKRRPAVRPRLAWIALAGIALGLGLLGVLLFSRPTATTLTADPVSESPAAVTLPARTAVPTADVDAMQVPSVLGGATLEDEAVQVLAEQIPTPEAGGAYGVWFVGTDGVAVLGESQFSDGTIRAGYLEPDDQNVLAALSRIWISLEPSPDPAPEVPGVILFAAEIPASVGGEARRLAEISRNRPLSAAGLEGLRTQSAAHDTHLQYSLEALVNGDLAGAKAHAEHVINILAGNAAPEYDDWDNNGRIENPGDGFGLIAYAALAETLASSELADEASTPGMKEAIGALTDDLDQLANRADGSIRLAQRIASSDSLDEARLIGDEWSGDVLAGLGETAAASAETVGLRYWIRLTPAP